MNILVLTNLYPPQHVGGYELICYHVVHALRARGHRIQILTSTHHARNGVPDEPQVERSLRIHGFYGHPWLPIHRLRLLEFHNNQILRDAIAKQNPDLVYVWNMGGLSKSMLFTLQRLNVPTLFYLSDHWIARGLTSDVWLNWWNRTDAPFPHRCVRSILTRTGFRRRCDAIAPTDPCTQLRFPKIYFCSRALRDIASAAGFSVGHAAIIHCPVNVDDFNAPPKPVDHPFRNLLCAGRLSPDKGMLTALQALALLPRELGLRLTICGDGNPGYREQLEQFARAQRLPAGFMSASHNEMPRIYPQFDALLFTSEWPEPFALTPLEAMASGLPVIATTTGGSAELFRHGDNSLTFAAGNAPELAERILRLARDPGLRTRIARAGYCEVRQNYAEPVIVDQIEALLHQTVASWHANPTL